MRFLKKQDGRIFVRQKDNSELGVMFRIPSNEYIFMVGGKMFTMKMLKKLHDKITRLNTQITIKNLIRSKR